MRALLREVETLVGLAKPQYDPWDNMQLLRHYLEGIVYGGPNWEGHHPNIWAQLHEIKTQLEEKRFDFDALNLPEENAIPVWLMLHRWVEIDPNPITRSTRKGACIRALKTYLHCDTPPCPECEYPVDPMIKLTHQEYLDVWHIFKSITSPSGGGL